MDASEMQVHVVAAVNLTQRSAQIASALPLPAAGGHEAAGVADDGGPVFVVRVVGGAGEVLHSQPAPFLPSACSIEGEDQTGLVDTVVPNVAGAAAVELLLDGEVLDRFDVGDGAVAPQLVGPGVAGLVAGTATGATITLNWAAPDAPAGQRYIVQVSADGGASWSTLAAGTPATSLEVDRDDFPAPPPSRCGSPPPPASVNPRSSPSTWPSDAAPHRRRLADARTIGTSAGRERMTSHVIALHTSRRR